MKKFNRTLANVVDSKKVQVSDVMKFGIQLFNTIEALHDMGICHQDIKPDNIMIGQAA